MKTALKFLILALSLIAPQLRAEELQATVISVSGKTQFYDATGVGQALKAGTMLRSGTRIATDQNGLAILLLADGSKLSLGPNTDLTLTEMTKTNESYGNVFNLIKGLIRASVQKLTVGSKFEVTSSHGVAAVKGTEFECESGEDRMEVRCSEGRIWLSDRRREHVLDVFKEMKGSCSHDKIEKTVPMKREEIERFGRWANDSIPKNTRRDAENKKFWDSLRPDQKLAAMNALKEALGDTWDEITTLKAEERQQRWRERMHAADERKLAGEDAQVDFALRKSTLDRQGRRVRFDEFLIRPSANQLQFLNYSKRDDRTDLMNVVNTYNKNLPHNLGEARDINQKAWFQVAQPEWWVTNSTVVFANSGGDSYAGGYWFFDPALVGGTCGCPQHWELPVQRVVLGLNVPDIAHPFVGLNLNGGVLLLQADRFLNITPLSGPAITGVTGTLGSNSLASTNTQASLDAQASDLRWTGGIGFISAGSLLNVAPTFTALTRAELGVSAGDLAKGDRVTFADGTYVEFRTYDIDENGKVQNLPEMLAKGNFSTWLNLHFRTYNELNISSNRFSRLGDIDVISQMMQWAELSRDKDSL